MIQHQEIESEEAFYPEVFHSVLENLKEEWDWNDDLDRVTDHALGMVDELVDKPVGEVIDSFLDSCPTKVEDLKLAILIQFCRLAERAGKDVEMRKLVEYLAKQRKKHD